MQDPRIGEIKPPPTPGPAPAPPPAELLNFPKPMYPHIGQAVWFFPHIGHHPEEYFGPHAAIVIRIHPGDPRICHLHYFGPKGESGSYADIPHRSLQPGCYPTSAWLGHAMPPATHWCHVGEMDQCGPPAPAAQAPTLKPPPGTAT
jgi:hypothetical protein